MEIIVSRGTGTVGPRFRSIYHRRLELRLGEPLDSGTIIPAIHARSLRGWATCLPMNTDTIDQRPEHTVLGVTRETELVWEGHMAEDTGATGGPLPCAKMTANQSEICIRGTRGEFHVPRTAIQRISKGKLYPWLFQAVQVHHTLPRCSRELQFKPTAVKLTEVFERLRALGYPVK